MTRIAKLISNAGICSRRDAEILIRDGRVMVDDVIVRTPATCVMDTSIIKVYGRLINIHLKTRLWIYYKPVGLITTHKDTHGRDTIFENLPNLPRVISIGRLDINSEGLLLLTNNGDLARKFELPSSKIIRVYKVRAFGGYHSLLDYVNTQKTVIIGMIKYNIESIKLCDERINFQSQQNSTYRKQTNSWFEVRLTEGKNREIRKIFEYFGLQVNRLIRIKYGEFELANLKPGECREIEY